MARTQETTREPPVFSQDKLEEQMRLAEEVQRAAEDAAAKVAAETASRRRATSNMLPPDVLENLADACVTFCQALCGVELYGYQQDFCWRVYYSLLSEDSDELTALFSRQSGKTETVATAVAGAMVLLPALARHLDDPRIQKFRAGVWIGIFGPSFDIAGIMYSRISTRLRSPTAYALMADPEINVAQPWSRAASLNLDNGSFVECNSAGPQSHIEGKTYHLIICEETQEIGNYKLRKSIHPMAAATGGSIIKIGTPCPTKNEFFDACTRNRNHDKGLGLGVNYSRRRRHFEYDFTYASKANTRYAAYVQKEIERLGFDSDDFKMAYRLIWVLERGHFITEEVLDSVGVKKQRKITARVPGEPKLVEFTLVPNVVTFDKANRHVVTIDFGRSQSSTVATAAKVFWQGGVNVGFGEMRYPVHVSNWLELIGDDHEKQYPQLVDFILNYEVDTVLVDATGKGDPIFSRLANDPRLKHVYVRPFVFSASSKDFGYKLFKQEIEAGRWTFPDGEHARKFRKQGRFREQMKDLEKSWRGATLVVQKADEKGAQDDYADSGMLSCWAANKVAFSAMSDEVEAPVYSRRGQRERSFAQRTRGFGGEASSGARSSSRNR